MDTLDPIPHLERFATYEQACRESRWLIPERFNIATAICRRHADAVTRIALNEVKEATSNTYTFGGLDLLSDKFATALSESGVKAGDSVAVILQQSAALAIAHLGALKAGAVVVPLAMSSEPGSLEHAVADSGAKAVVVDESILLIAEAFARRLSHPTSLFVVCDLRRRPPITNHKDFWTEVDRASSDFDAAETDADSPAFIFYSKAHGRTAGVVHSHRALIGQLTAFEMCNNFQFGDDAVFWTPEDWASPRSLLWMLHTSWLYGCAVVASEKPVLPVDVSWLIERCNVTNAFIPSHLLSSMKQAETQPRERFDLKLRVVVTGDLTERGLAEWARDSLGAQINASHLRDETGVLIAGCGSWFAARPGSIGRAAPGHSIAIIDERGIALPPRKTGYVAINRSDPALFVEYRGDPAGTARAFAGDWFVTGDFGFTDEDGYVWLSKSL